MKHRDTMQGMFQKGIYEEKKMRYVHEKIPNFNPENIQVFFDIQIAEPGHEMYAKERVVFELFAKNKTDHNNHKDLPITCENFRALCTGECLDINENLHYKGNIFHGIDISREAHGGDVIVNTGEGGYSIYGKTFADE